MDYSNINFIRLFSFVIQFRMIIYILQESDNIFTNNIQL